MGDLRKEDTVSLLDFKDRLGDLGHFVTEYTDINDLKYQVRDQLDKLMDSGNLPGI